jgi:hypothetical protein
MATDGAGMAHITAVVLPPPPYSLQQTHRICAIHTSGPCLGWGGPDPWTPHSATPLATEKPYGYLLIDFKPETDEKLRVRTNIFTSDSKHYVYVPK